ncbi:MAG: hypothetical protein ACM3IJ_01635 [Candidatus Levyibacteriota bacterium]
MTESLRQIQEKQEHIERIQQLCLETGDTLHLERRTHREQPLVGYIGGENSMPMAVAGIEALFGSYRAHRTLTRSPRDTYAELKDALNSGKIDMAILPSSMNAADEQGLPVISEFTARRIITGTDGRPSEVQRERLQLLGKGKIEPGKK